MAMDGVIWSIGHSTRTLSEFLELLAAYRIQAVADVRRYPGSRRLPQFERQALAGALAARDIDYLWLPQLGGRRTPHPQSDNTAWRSASFRGYADHMATASFADGLVELMNVARGERTAMLCAEALWWRCHRGLIADVLRWMDWRVCHILSDRVTVIHPYTSAARVGPEGLHYRHDQMDLVADLV
jgi:uncharacterized protein (DUF488 family)